MDVAKLKRLTGVGDLTGAVSRVWNQQEFDAFVAAATLMILRNGEEKPEEVATMKAEAQEAEWLKGFSEGHLLERYKEYANKVKGNPTRGETQLMEVIGKISGEPQKGSVILASICQIGLSDGDFDADEVALAEKVGSTLKLGAEHTKEIINNYKGQQPAHKPGWN